MSAIQIITIVLLSVILISFVSFFILTYICYAASIRKNGIIGKFINKKFTTDAQNYGIDRSFWKAHPVKRLTLENNGLKLAGFYVANQNSNKLAIVIHGYFSNHLDMTIQAKIFYDMGYNVFCPDLRAHGESQGKTIGMGYFDKIDIIKWMELLNSKYKPNAIAIFGWSMGGATACLVAGEKLPENVKCIIADCAYTTAYEEFEHVLKWKKHPTFPVLKLANLGSKMYGEYFLKEADCVKSVKKSTLPILFIHGENDTFVPAFMTDELYKAKEVGDRRKEIFSGAEHCKSYVSNKERYVQVLKEWVETYIR